MNHNIKDQETQYIDSNIERVFHFLELRGSHNFLIGSNKIRNILYANDYDLNSEIGVNDSETVLTKIYKDFLNIFHKAHQSPDYYIIDFKCGTYNDEPIRWSYDDMKRGLVQRGVHTITFEECLLMDDNTIKLDLCYLYNDIFTDINCLYNLFLVHNKAKLSEKKAEAEKKVAGTLRKEIKELEHEGEYFKALKRYFSLGIIHGRFDEDILDLLNSDYGRMYKVVNFLKLVIEMIEQDFKPVSMAIVRSNLEYIKQFASHITTIRVENYLNRLIKIIKMNSIQRMRKELNVLMDDCSKSLNAAIHNLV